MLASVRPRTPWAVPPPTPPSIALHRPLSPTTTLGRTIHRGLPNCGGRERAVAYVACASGGASDVHNFPEAGIHEAGRQAVAQLQFWNAPGRGRAQDNLEYFTELEGADPFGLPPG